MANDTAQHDDEQAFRQLVRSVVPDTTPPPGCEERLRLRLKARILAGAPTRRAGEHRRHSWGRGLRFASAGAAMVIAAIVIWWLAGGGVRTASADFAEMLRRVRQANTVAYDQILRVPGQPETEVRILMARSGRARVTASDGKVAVFDLVQRKLLRLLPDTKTAVLRPLALGSAHYDPLDDLRRAKVSAGRFVGRETLDNQEAVVYQVVAPQGRMRVWVDPDEELPIRIEVRSRVANALESLTILKNFNWNRPIPDSKFSLDVPPGYTLAPPPPEASLIRLLRICARMNDGSFPARLDARTVFESVLRNGQPADNSYGAHTGVTPIITDGDDRTKETYKACLHGLAFVEQVNENGTWQYVGQGVRLGDGAARVCWWKPPGTASFRMVYGDLQVRNVTAERLQAPAKRPSAKTTDRDPPEE